MTEGKNAYKCDIRGCKLEKEDVLKKKARFFVKTALWPSGSIVATKCKVIFA